MFHLQINEFLNSVCEQIKYKPIRNTIAEELKDHIEDKKEELAAISQKLSGEDVRERARELNGMINVCKLNNQKLDREYFRLVQQQGELGIIIKNAENERSNLALKDKNNIKIEKISIKCNINDGLDENNAALY